MSHTLYSQLQWLPKPPADFSARCRALASLPSESIGTNVRELASFSLDENQLHRLAKAIESARRDGRALAPLIPFRLGLLSNATLDLIEPALIASAARHGFALECVRGDYNQVIQEAVSPDSILKRASPDAVLLALDFRGYALRAKLGDKESAESAVLSSLQFLDSIRAGIKSNSKAICIVQTLAPPAEALFGSLDCGVPGATRNLVDSINRNISRSIRGTQDVLFDVASLAETIGLANWHSPAQWNMAKLPFSDSCLPLYADHVARIIAALQGKSRRCLVLDLDNTLWGGVIGDDGLQGIRLAQGDATGEAHLSVQSMALALRERGIVLAVCSKNEDEVARSPFRRHPEMLLKEEHIAVFQANWNDKATNLEAIAKELSLGLESLVFLDDNPAERALVRSLLPQVAVPELPSDPALYARTLAAAGYFESVAFSDEDVKRAGFYQDNARRAVLSSQFADLGEYLASLEMKIAFQPFDHTGRARITQLINKSNQFNLTTRRYTETEIERMESDPRYFTLQVRLSDIFGDNGMISVVICAEGPDSDWEIDTWLMSCRVLGRRVENMVLHEILEHAKSRGITRLVGTYIPTERNKLVEDHYAKLGFSRIAERENGATVWELDVQNAVVELAPMSVSRINGEAIKISV